jgi:hypothetical protein
MKKQGISVAEENLMRRTLNILMLAAAPVLSCAAINPTVTQSAPRAAASATPPQANSQASSHDRHHRKNSTAIRHRHHHKNSSKH